VLERWGVIFVTAAGSGNKANVVTRRMPLALAAARDVMARYRVDPDLVLIAGFSGGSRVALRLAIAHPELFHGVLLNAGSDPIDDADRPIPPPPLLRLFQERTRLVYVTGEQDGINRDLDHQSRASLDRWCVFAVEDQPMSGRGHVVADAFALDQALATLLAPQAPPDRDKLDACRAGLPER
jgi:pimeloyl-ACP methyl ester carboxylesterase